MPRIKIPQNARRHGAVTAYWKQYFVNRDMMLCGLCGNSGVVDTRGRAKSVAGVDAGIQTFCMCPNGHAMRKGAGMLSDTD